MEHRRQTSGVDGRPATPKNSYGIESQSGDSNVSAIVGSICTATSIIAITQPELGLACMRQLFELKTGYLFSKPLPKLKHYF